MRPDLFQLHYIQATAREFLKRFVARMIVALDVAKTLIHGMRYG
jgi:hypothetical protein